MCVESEFTSVGSNSLKDIVGQIHEDEIKKRFPGDQSTPFLQADSSSMCGASR